jgi:hypothetical protein
MKIYGGVVVYTHHLLPRKQMEVSGQLHALVALPRGRSLRYPLDRRRGGP